MHWKSFRQATWLLKRQSGHHRCFKPIQNQLRAHFKQMWLSPRVTHNNSCTLWSQLIWLEGSWAWGPRVSEGFSNALEKYKKQCIAMGDYCCYHEIWSCMTPQAARALQNNGNITVQLIIPQLQRFSQKDFILETPSCTLIPER